MKLFTKLALVSAVAVSGSAMAMESMDDSALSSTTGQDGISIGLKISKIAIENLYIHDNDGLATGTAATPAVGNPGDPGYTPAVPASATYGLGGTGKAGAITITGTGSATINGGANATDGLVIAANTDNAGAYILPSHNFADLTIDSDAGTGANGAFLNIGAKVSGLKIYVGKIGVAKSNAVQASGAVRGIDTTASNNTIINGLSLSTGITSANIQLGATPQGAMIVVNGTMNGGLQINNLGIVDNAGGGQITIGKISLADHGGTDLSTNAKVSVTPDGLAITAMETASDLYISNISLSGSGTQAAWVKGPSIGDVEVSNMRVFNGTAGTTPGAIITVSGH